MITSRHRRIKSPTGPFYVRLVGGERVETGWFAMLDHAGHTDRNLEALGPEDPRLLPSVCDRIIAAMNGEDACFNDIDLPSGTAFQRSVWRATRRIRRGERLTYGAVATAAGRPAAARAVGQAMRRNPQPIITPCHRVVSASGLGGFGGHVEGGDWPAIKATLLAAETTSP